MKTNYLEFYKHITRNYQSKQSQNRIRLINNILTRLYYVAYPALLIYPFAIQSEKKFPTILILLLTIIVVTILRKVVACPRPYEEFQIEQIL